MEVLVVMKSGTNNIQSKKLQKLATANDSAGCTIKLGVVIHDELARMTVQNSPVTHK